jgi:Tfp pilus assembly protein PilE
MAKSAPGMIFTGISDEVCSLKTEQNGVRFRQEEGFTFLEFFISILIIGLLIFTAIRYYGDIPEYAARQAVRTDFDTFKTAIRIFYLKNQRLPQDLDELVTKQVMAKNPTDKFMRGTELTYRFVVTKAYIRIWSRGPNGADENGDNIPPHDDLSMIVYNI